MVKRNKGYITNMSGYDYSAVTDMVNKVLADYQARLGRFLTYKQTLINLLARAKGIQAVDARGPDLVSRVQSAQSNQSALENQGMGIFASISNIKANPIYQVATNTAIDVSVMGDSIIARLNQLYTDMQSITSSSLALNNAMKAHESTVSTLDKDITNIEGDLSGRGILNKLTSFATAPVSMLKYVAIIGVIVLAVIYLPKPKRSKS